MAEEAAKRVIELLNTNLYSLSPDRRYGTAHVFKEFDMIGTIRGL